MRQSQNKNRSRGRGNRKSGGGGGGGGNNMNRVFDSAGPEGKVRGTPQQIIDKYLALARDAQTSGDRVAAENFLQHAEHYQRILIAATSEQEKARREAQAASEASNEGDEENADQDDRQGNRANGHGNGNGNGNNNGRSQNRKPESIAIEGMAMIDQDGESDGEADDLIVSSEDSSPRGGRRPRKRRTDDSGDEQPKAEAAES